MASTTSENYITETIFVPLYKRSAGLRKLISRKFGVKVDFGSSIFFTGNERNTEFTEKYGCPDAKTNTDNIIEVKTNKSTGLTLYEQKNGYNGIGYETYLKEHPDKYLLYVVPDGYNLDQAVKVENRVKHITWQEIIDYLDEQNEYDPFISLISEKVDGIEDRERWEPDFYKAKVYEVLIKTMELDNKLRILIDQNGSNINLFPEKMFEGDADCINFEYDGNTKDEYNICFEKDTVSFYLPGQFSVFKKIAETKKFAFNTYWEQFQFKILSQIDFRKLGTEEIAKKVVKGLKIFINVYTEMEKEIDNTKIIFFDKFLLALRKFTQDKGLCPPVVSEKKNDITFNFQKKGKKWYYAFQFQKYYWSDFCYGIGFEGKNNRKKYSKILNNSDDDGTWWVSWKNADESLIYWDKKIFEEIESNPDEFIGKHIKPMIDEIDKAVKKVEK